MSEIPKRSIDRSPKRFWEEPQEDPWRVLGFTVRRLLTVAAPGYQGARVGEARRVMVHAFNNLRRVLLRTPNTVLISTPKSGRTWLRYMLDRLGLHIRYTHMKSRQDVPEDLPSRMIHLHRDPRDTVISAWYQHRKRRKDYTGSLEEFLRDPVFGVEQRVRFNLFWAHHVSVARGLIVSYERLHADTAGELSRVASYIKGRPIARDKVEDAVAAGAFDKMRILEASGAGADLYGFALAPAEVSDPESYKTRRGRVGEWRTVLSEEDLAFAEEILRRTRYFELMEAFSRIASE